MEEHEKGLELSKRRRNGQTLVEFALTLPILLLLLFGIIEFGRIFQAWVTLQNSARAAARYATTGRYDPAYVINTNGADDENSVVPCIATATDERGVRAVYMPNNPANYANHIDGFERGLEMLYATWYGGDDCSPEQDTDQNNRKDLLRILSIINEARVGAAGLAVGPIPYLTTPLPAGDEYRNLTINDWRSVPWFNVWDRPLPSGAVENARLAGSDQPTWFDVMICSARLKLDGGNSSTFDASVFSLTNDLRFRTVRDVGDTTPGAEVTPSEDLVVAYAPACLLNETGNDTYETNNGGHPWLDAGGPGDVVTIVITFNHPL
ncbi:MAG: pilus assembly protein, partial [Anaerolineae bacterium]|nr:pilus assembly protein [Anaerolineae bacterium]